MRLVLDANEYLYAFGDDRQTSSQELLARLIGGGQHDVRIVRTIVVEVIRNSPPSAHKPFFDALAAILEEGCDIDEDFVIPYHRGEHFQEVGFKKADALIAAYAEAVGADVLVSENRRHFHAFADELPFHVMDATAFLRHHAR